jgi:erythromycin esterase
VDPAAAQRLRERYDIIRTAHDLPEHVQHTQGVHPGRPFTELAREAFDLVGTLPHTEGTQEAQARARHIVDYHAESIANGFDYGALRHRAVDRLTSLVRERGTKVAYWDGVALTANAPRLEPFALFEEPIQTVGSALRDELGAGYALLLITFGHGDLGDLHQRQRAPEPRPDSLNAALTAAGPQRSLLDLRGRHGGAVTEWLRGPHLLRIIAGIYDSQADSEHYLSVGPLDEWFDAILHTDTITPTTLL